MNYFLMFHWSACLYTGKMHCQHVPHPQAGEHGVALPWPPQKQFHSVWKQLLSVKSFPSGHLYCIPNSWLRHLRLRLPTPLLSHPKVQRSTTSFCLQSCHFGKHPQTQPQQEAVTQTQTVCLAGHLNPHIGNMQHTDSGCINLILN